jgi:ribose transport system permease protein
LIVLVVTELTLGHTIANWRYWDALVVLSGFLAILALGQGTVILTGGLDLSVPWTIGFCGILLAGMVHGSDAALLYALPIVLALACLIGFFNGVGVVALGLSPIVITLAMNGFLQGAALLYSHGTPAGFASPLLRWFMTGRVVGITPVIFFLVAFVIFAVVLGSATEFASRASRAFRSAARSSPSTCSPLSVRRLSACSSPAFPDREASAWVTTISSRPSQSWWSAAR